MIDKSAAIFLVCFALFYAWCSALFAANAGWPALARRFRARLPMNGTSFEDQLFSINGSTLMGRATRLTVGPEGLLLTPRFAHRIGAPPLLIPWKDVRALDDGRLSGHMSYRMQLGEEANIVIGDLAYVAMRRFLLDQAA